MALIMRMDPAAELRGENVVRAYFAARLGELTFWRGRVIERPDGEFKVDIPGRKSCGISLNRDGDIFRDVSESALRHYEEHYR